MISLKTEVKVMKPRVSQRTHSVPGPRGQVSKEGQCSDEVDVPKGHTGSTAVAGL